MGLLQQLAALAEAARRLLLDPARQGGDRFGVPHGSVQRRRVPRGTGQADQRAGPMQGPRMDLGEEPHGFVLLRRP